MTQYLQFDSRNDLYFITDEIAKNALSQANSKRTSEILSSSLNNVFNMVAANCQVNGHPFINLEEQSNHDFLNCINKQRSSEMVIEEYEALDDSLVSKWNSLQWELDRKVSQCALATGSKSYSLMPEVDSDDLNLSGKDRVMREMRNKIIASMNQALESMKNGAESNETSMEGVVREDDVENLQLVVDDLPVLELEETDSESKNSKRKSTIHSHENINQKLRTTFSTLDNMVGSVKRTGEKVGRYATFLNDELIGQMGPAANSTDGLAQSKFEWHVSKLTNELPNQKEALNDEVTDVVSSGNSQFGNLLMRNIDAAYQKAVSQF